MRFFRYILVFGVAVFAIASVPAQNENELPERWEKYDALLKKYVNERGFADYDALKKNEAELNRALAPLGALSKAEYERLFTDEKIAYWINAYNAWTLKAVIDHYPIEVTSFIRGARFPDNSIRQIDGVWDELKFPSPLGRVTLEDIEHEILRDKFDEPRLHMAINCASVSCPPLRREAYAGEKLDGQLSDQSRNFLKNERNFRIDREEGDVYLSSIFKWFGEDFVSKYGSDAVFKDRDRKLRAVLKFIATYAEKSDRAFLLREDYDIRYIDYDWSLNEE